MAIKMIGLGRQPRISTVPFEDFASCMTIVGLLILIISLSEKFGKCVKELKDKEA